MLLFSQSGMPLHDSIFQGAGVPLWVSSYGVRSPFGEDILTGFGMGELKALGSDALEQAKTQAMDDLVRKIRVRITSEVTSRQSASALHSSSYVSSVTKSTASLQLPNVAFLVKEYEGISYALAYVKRATLISEFSDLARSSSNRILLSVKDAGEKERRGDNAAAAEAYLLCLPEFDKLYESYSLVHTLSPSTLPAFFAGLDTSSMKNWDDVTALEQNLRQKIDTLTGLASDSFDEALEKIVILLKKQGLSSGNFLSPAFTYQQTDFSSPFGQYVAVKLSGLLNEKLPKGNTQYIVQGSYWIHTDDVELFTLVRLSQQPANVVGSVSATFPRNSAPRNYELEPQNHEQALQDLMEFEEGAMTDGGIHLDIWTSKGKSEDAQVYIEGEKLNLYIRVNQPCTLQITYILATSEKVLLEEGFFIGIDKVNRVVRYPYSFDVVPPLGVERLIVTAFSGTPPIPAVRPTFIEGEQYMIFDSVKDVVAQARGLRKSDSADAPRTGEAQLAITTIPK
jgi:hypothetical protein